MGPAATGSAISSTAGSSGVYDLHNERNPMFPGLHNPEPIPGNLRDLCGLVPRMGAQLGLATDGDADRLGACDEKGGFLNQLTVMSLLALYLLEVRGLRGPIVKTFTSSTMLNRLGERFDVPVHETAVGFKYVAPKMLETNALLGGEESGGYAFRGHVPERDGILAGLFLLDYVVQSGQSPSKLVEHLFDMVGPHHYDRPRPGLPAGRTRKHRGAPPCLRADEARERRGRQPAH